MNVISVQKHQEFNALTFAFQLPADDYVLVVENTNPDPQDIELGQAGLYFEVRDQRWGTYDAIQRIKTAGHRLTFDLTDETEVPDDMPTPIDLDCSSASGDVDVLLLELVAAGQRAGIATLSEGKVS